MSPNTSTKNPIVFVHGLWLHAESWHQWMKLFRENGYQAVAASWPGDSENTKATRKNADAVAGYGVAEIADHIARQLKTCAAGISPSQPLPSIRRPSRVWLNCRSRR